MKRFAILLATLAVSSCVIGGVGIPVIGNGNIAEKTIDATGFEAICVDGAMDVYYIQSTGEFSVLLRTDENLLDVYTFEVKGGALRISSEKGKNPVPRSGAVAVVMAPGVNSVKINGSGDCTMPGMVELPGDFSFTVNGSGDLNAYGVWCKDFSCRISGSGDIEVESVTAETASVVINGSGDVDLVCKDAGDVDVRISGSGDVSLRGNARSLSQKINGSGSIDVRGLTLSE